jgi:hypothetical protein
VSHDKDNQVIFPIAEFLTTAHDSLTISKYLLSIKHHLKESDYESTVRIVVTDFSWALMNSVINIFNGCTIMAYLTWCYDHLYGLGIHSSSIKTIHIHCCVHTLKNVIRKSKHVKCDPKVRNCFIFCFSLLQNAVQPEDFEAILINIYSLFNQKFTTKYVLMSLSFLRERILHRKLDQKIDPKLEEDIEYLDKKAYLASNQQDNILMMTTETVESLKLSSPFQIYFNDVIKKCETSVTFSNQNSTNTILNEFFHPQLFFIIQSMLYLVPFWSGLMLLDKGIGDATRLDNNACENWFGNLKVHILQMLVMPSQLAGVLYERLLVKYFEFYFNFEKKETINLNTIETIDEKFKEKKKGKNFNKEKGLYYKNNKIFSSWETEKIEDKQANANVNDFGFKVAFEIRKI